MVSTALRPRSVSEIVDAAFQILRAHYGQFVMCSALAYLPWLVLELLFLGDPEQWAGTHWWVALLAGVGVWLTFALMSAVIITCASQTYLGEPVDVAAAVRRALPRLPRVMFAAVLRYVLLVVGFVFFLVGPLYVAARLFALTPVIILEDASLPQAFARTGPLSIAFLLLQSTERHWPAAAVHDTVQAVLRDPAFRRSLRRSLADRMLLWMSEWFERLMRLSK